jgi:hypothetical protein
MEKTCTRSTDRQNSFVLNCIVYRNLDNMERTPVLAKLADKGIRTIPTCFATAKIRLSEFFTSSFDVTGFSTACTQEASFPSGLVNISISHLSFKSCRTRMTPSLHLMPMAVLRKGHDVVLTCVVCAKRLYCKLLMNWGAYELLSTAFCAYSVWKTLPSGENVDTE